MASASKLYSKELSWDFVDFKHGSDKKPKSTTRKKWSKLIRNTLKKDLRKEQTE